MQTLIPQPATATAKPLGKTGRVLGFGLTPLALLLIAAGLLMAIPAFFHIRRIGFMLGWDALLAVLILIDALRLPRPEDFTITRSFIDSPQLGQPTRIELAVRMESDAVLDVRLVDDLHSALVAAPTEQRLEVFPREEVVSAATIYPSQRGDFALGRVFLRYRGAFRLVERWAAAEPVVKTLGGDEPHKPQRVRVFPAHEDSRERTQFYLLRARQIEMQKRKLRLRGVGREFESMRDYQQGDELRNVSWTATARRGKLVTRQFTVERSQQVWMVLDAGRLSRTAFEVKRDSTEAFAETTSEREAAHLLTVTQLDQAATAATMLAQVINGSGDKFGLMAYGRDVQQLLPPGAGASHVRLMIDLLSQTRSEASEADHLNAVARLKTAQRRRGLIVWITELVDSAGRPELVTAASELVRRHLVVLVLLKHPELDELAARTPKISSEMFHTAAAQEMLERRRETIAQLERQGVLIVETTAAEVGMRAVSKYLEVKASGLL
ncbi:DUF58 domain-containing protein [Granulicella mallensis]|uniref:Uncharacterized protein (DUF58 family) n=1 Tax=Granulicella mallensis TaxID=940614 RepID=A0A7W8EC81_9BACT|nr:DUF58 domain-containing protein [Granulicella mallensis]MBB5066379.1 uncharacterized protein (DUF58 family) [Granulicella mallensis]